MESTVSPANVLPQTRSSPTFSGHIQICRFDHWVKNVFVLPGLIVAIGVSSEPIGHLGVLLIKIVAGLIATGLIASSNYVINEIKDAPFDLEHPVKRSRPVPSGQVNVPLGYVQWIALMIAGLALGWMVSRPLAVVLAILWAMGCVYNLRPIRSKDLPYLDVLSESVNNPLRMLAGWFIVNPNAIAPASLLLSYWMVGCYFMAAKRFSEFRAISHTGRAGAYRKSFAYYDEPRLLVSIMFYAAAAMLFFGAFCMRYRFELILAFPLVAWVMALYLKMSFDEDSAAQAPEKLYREKLLMTAVVITALVMAALCWAHLPALYHWFEPTAPTRQS